MKTRIVLSLLALCSAGQAATLLSEGFDNIGTLAGAGWVQTNASVPLGLTNWFQGNAAVFSAHSGAADSYIAANFNNTSGEGAINNYLITPQLTSAGGAELSFYTISAGGNEGFPDRLRVLWSANGASTALADFSTVLLDINPTLSTSTDPVTGYPNVWTNYTALLPAGSGRLAFEYFIPTSAGPLGANSDYIGIDTLAVADIPEPGSMVLLGGGMLALALLRRRNAARE